LVHDTDGYQPVAWLTRPESLSVTRDPLWLLASDGDETLRIEAAGDVALTEHEATDAGTPVGDCRCGGQLVRRAPTSLSRLRGAVRPAGRRVDDRFDL